MNVKKNIVSEARHYKDNVFHEAQISGKITNKKGSKSNMLYRFV